MARKKDTGTGEVVSLNAVRKDREIDRVLEKIQALSEDTNKIIADLVDGYHEWEAAFPDKAVSPADKLEMATWGFVGRLGLDRCRQEHRLPSLAVYGSGDEYFPTEEEIAEDLMCPALESGRCQTVLEVFGRPPCILLGAELQQVIAPRRLTILGRDALMEGWHDGKAQEKKRFARARALVREYERHEREARKKAQQEARKKAQQESRKKAKGESGEEKRRSPGRLAGRSPASTGGLPRAAGPGPRSPGDH